MHGTVPRGVLGPGETATNRSAPVAEGRRKVGAHLGEGGKRGGEVGNGGDINPEESEYGCTVHYYAIASGPLQGNGEEAGGMGGDAAVGEDVH